MTRRLVLFFAYHFPPDNEIGAARPYRFFKYLPEYGYECHVFTAAAPGAQSLPGVTYVPDPLSSSSDRGIGRSMELVLRKFVVPGQVGFRWAFDASRQASKFIARNRDARIAVFATFPPSAPLVAARLLRRESSLKWISDFRDPMVAHDETSFLQRRFVRWLESESIVNADLVIANTEAARQMFVSNYPQQDRKIQVIFNGFDPDDVPLAPPPDSTPRVFSHVGDLYNGRDPRMILDSVRRLLANGKLLSSQFRLQFIGSSDPSLFAGAADGVQQGWLKYTLERVPKQQAGLIMEQSHGLLLIDFRTARNVDEPGKDANVQVPAKLFEYVRMRRPILAYLRRDSPTERLLQQSGVFYRAFYPDSPQEDIDRVIGDLLVGPSPSSSPNEWFETNFNAKRQAKQLAAMIDRLYE